MAQEHNIIQLGYLLSRSFTGLVDDLNVALRAAGIDLNHSQFTILQLLIRCGKEAMSQREIATKLGKDPAAVSRAVAHLEQNGFIERFAVNGSKNGVSLTDKARCIQPAILKIVEEVSSKACRGIPKDEIRIGLTFLCKLINNK